MIKMFVRKISDRFVSHWIVLLIDLILVAISFFLAYFIRFNLSFNFDEKQFFYQLPTVLILAGLSFFIVGSYKGVIRHTGLKDADNIFTGVNFLATFIIITVFISRSFDALSIQIIPSSIIFIHYLLNLFLLIASRFLFKTIYRYLTSDLKLPNNIMIFGAGSSGILTRDVINNDDKNSYKVIGFIDDNVNKIGKQIDGLKIYSLKHIDEKFIQKYDLKEVIISIKKIDQTRLMEVIDALIAHDIKAKIVPPVEEWMDGDLKIGQIKEVRIEDLLDRESIDIKNEKIENDVCDRVILVTGAAGSIGSEICRQIAAYRCSKIILLDQAESALYDLQQELRQKDMTGHEFVIADIVNVKRLTQIFERYKPSMIFHAAAYKHVPLVENNPFEGVNVNINGTKILADLAIQFGVEKFVMVSTDKAVNPTNVMGATKRVAEMYASCLNEKEKTKFIITRFGNVLGSNGSVIPLFKKQLESGGPLTVTHKEITRYFMTIPEACQLVLEAGAMGNGGEIFVFDMGASVKIYDLAKKMIKLSGLRYPEDIDIKITGLRPGEKLYEELLSDGENTLPTYHEKIMIAKTSALDSNQIITSVENFCQDLHTYDNNQTVGFIKSIVPEYISKNSSFEILDSVKIEE